MNDRMFDRPVYVKKEENLVVEIADIDDAVEFMYEWPKHRRGPIFDAAYRACRSALDDYPVPAAKSAFIGFARSANILYDMDAMPAPWASGVSGQNGGLIA